MPIYDDQKVSDITVGELKELIREAILNLIDPDVILKLKPEIEEELKKSILSKERFSVENVAKELGLKW